MANKTFINLCNVFMVVTILTILPVMMICYQQGVFQSCATEHDWNTGKEFRYNHVHKCLVRVK